jgi:hypothetical protein
MGVFEEFSGALRWLVACCRALGSSFGSRDFRSEKASTMLGAGLGEVAVVFGVVD